MQLQLNDQITINATAEKVWHVLAHEFSQIAQYASAIPASQALRDIPSGC
jgi:hypothetical protein